MVLDELLELYILEDEKLTIIALTNNIYRDTDVIYKVIPPINVNYYVRNVIFNKITTTITQNQTSSNTTTQTTTQVGGDQQNNNNQSSANVSSNYFRLSNIEINIPPIIAYSYNNDSRNYVILNFSHIVNYISKTNNKTVNLILEEKSALDNQSLYSKTQHNITTQDNQTITYFLYRNIQENKYYVEVNSSTYGLYSIRNKSTSTTRNFISSIINFMLNPFSFLLGASGLPSNINSSIGSNTELTEYTLLLEVPSNFFSDYKLYSEISYIPVYSPRIRNILILDPSDTNTRPLSIYSQLLPLSDVYVYLISGKILFNLTYSNGSFVYYPRITLNISPIFINLSSILSDEERLNYLNNSALYFIPYRETSLVLSLNQYLSNLPSNTVYYFMNTTKPTIRNTIYSETIYVYNKTNNEKTVYSGDDAVFVSNLTTSSSLDNINYITNINNYFNVYSDIKNIYNTDNKIDTSGGVNFIISTIYQLLTSKYLNIFSHLLRNTDYKYIQITPQFNWISGITNTFKINSGYSLTVKSVEIKSYINNNTYSTIKFFIPVITDYNNQNNNTTSRTFNLTNKYKIDTIISTTRALYSTTSSTIFSFVKQSNYVGVSKENKLIYQL